jgi:hypothetical protein
VLLDKGADPNGVDRGGCGALYYALKDSLYVGGPDDRVSDKVVSLLINRGANAVAKGVTNEIANLSKDDPRVRAYFNALALQSTNHVSGAR